MSETGSSNDDAPSTRDGQSSRSETGKITHRLLHCCNTSESISNDSCSAMSSSLVFRHSQAQDVFLKTGAGAQPVERGNMGELVGQPAAKAGIDRSVAERPIGIILEFLRSERPDEAQPSIGQNSQAEAAIVAPNRNSLARWMGDIELTGPRLAGCELARRGFGMAHIQAVPPELLRFARDQIRADRMGEIIAGTLGLSQFA